MENISIPTQEFSQRLDNIRREMEKDGLDGLMIYGDEYRKENLRYACNFWPIFERGACFIPKQGQPIVVGAPEGESYAREMSVWRDIRNIKEFACVSVPEEIDYPNAEFSSLHEILREVLNDGRKLGVIGCWDIPGPIMTRISNAIPGLNIIDAAGVFDRLRIVKTESEIACLKEAGRQACEGYRKLIEFAVPGNTELQAAGAAEGAARMAGAEDINFMVFGSGKRAETIIGRATNKIIEDGDAIMAAMAVQYEGYVATVEFPFVVGTPSDGQKRFLNVLLEAVNTQMEYLKSGIIAGDMVKAVKNVFRKHNMQEYDVYPPLHGIGLAEAESPYPDENAGYPFQTNMCVNSDISLFGHPDGSNRVEEGFVIKESGPESLTPFIRELCEKGI